MTTHTKKLRSYTIVTIAALLLIIGYQVYRHRLQKSAQCDIDFIHATILENHPGSYNEQDPDFRKNMDIAYLDAHNAIKSMRSTTDQTTIVTHYLDSFHDTHVRLYPAIKNSTPTHINTRHHFTIQEIPNNSVWITVPTFAPNATQQKELEAIIDQMPAYKTKNCIIFDVRNNNGSNSHWGTKIIEKLFGVEYAKLCINKIHKNIEVHWRASKDNTHHISSLIPKLIDQFGANAPIIQEFQSIAHGMQKAYQQNNTFFIAHHIPQPHSHLKPNHSVTAHIAIIINARCVSACLDFIDEMKAVDPTITLIGQTTDADSIYMDVRVVDLPSGIGTLQFPIKMYHNRKRGHNIPYVPDISYPDTIHSPEEINEWLLQTVQKIS